ncbi:RNA-directed DNA polymerase, eukaryota [Tanacetum coccineum]|uniref:RNA-directed DNA polymerase, eukaryota n=1 Tax=Tanacetum coccineum TaxID=301880 RepID=A0ABQ5G0E5_9ASTR
MCRQPLPPPLSPPSAKLMIMALEEYGYQDRRGIRVPKKWKSSYSSDLLKIKDCKLDDDVDGDYKNHEADVGNCQCCTKREVVSEYAKDLPIFLSIFQRNATFLVRKLQKAYHWVVLGTEMGGLMTFDLDDPMVKSNDVDLLNPSAKVVDVYIPLKRSKTGKKFAFVRFLKVDNMERLIENLCTIWIGRFHLHANPVRFQRESMASFVQPSKVKINTGPVKNSFASVLKSNDHKGSPSSDSSPAIVMDDSCIVDNDLSCSLMGKIKDINALSNIYVIFADEGFDNVNISYLGGFWILIEACSVASKEKMLNHEGLASWFSELCIADPSFVSEDRLVWISIEGLPFNTWNNNAYAKIISQWGTLSEVDTTPDSSSSAKKICVVTKVHTIINQRIKIIVKGKIYWICVKELEAWAPEFNNEFCENSSSDEESMEDGEFNSQKVDDIDHISESSYPFGIHSILKRYNQKEKSKDARKSDPSFPHGFTPKGVNETIEEEENVSVNKFNSNHHSNKKTGSNGKCGSNRSFKLKAGGLILDVMEDLIEIGHVMGYNMEGCLGHTSKKDWIQELNLKYKVNFATIQETKSEKIDLFAIKSLWGNFNFDFVYSPSVGLSGGILCVWNPNVFAKESVTVSDSFVAVRGTWISSSLKLMFVSVYAPQDISERKSLWDYIKHMINLWDGECIILGDFNEVRSENERFGTIFNDIGAKAFNHFISSSCLIDLPLEGYSFTWALKSGSKMSKLDRFLISEGLISIFPSLAAICLDRRLSDHRPILLRESSVDYGPTPFRVFHSWFTKDGFDNLIADTWNNLSIMETNKISLLRKKFQALKAIIKNWSRDEMLKASAVRHSAQSRISELDKLIDKGLSNNDIINERISLLKDIHDLDKRHSSDLAQKAKIQWAIEGDENSKYFHGIINKKRSQLAIRGVLVDGEWIEDPPKVKNEFLEHFSNRFSMPTGQTINLDSHMFQKISIDQNADLESDVSLEEIKKAVWECGTNKSPGPDGFSFEFIRKYWNIIQHDVVNAVKEFFSSSKFPPGSNSSFITLIPKSLDAKMVKDFRPISLIGSFYKIVAKILSNRLCIVMPDLISDVQTAFISKRQILDGPFILNELISWCKYHKIKAMIFKADFEKAFDSVRWDYLDGVLNNFGFGVKWRGWIQAGFILRQWIDRVNGSLSQEFKFHKVLSQGDPLSPFLFILVMKSLHISFNNILNSGLYKGIRIDESLTLSHLFYADDAIFIGKWDKANVRHYRDSLMVAGIMRYKISRWLGKNNGFQGKKEGLGHKSYVWRGWSFRLHCKFARPVFLHGTIPFVRDAEILSSKDDHLLLAVGAPTRWVSEVPIKINIMAWKVVHAHIFFSSCSMAPEHYLHQTGSMVEFDCPDLFSNYDD